MPKVGEIPTCTIVMGGELLKYIVHDRIDFDYL
jgi:hypothetical protein